MYFAWNPVIGGGVRGLFRDDIFLHQYVSFIWNQKHVSVKRTMLLKCLGFLPDVNLSCSSVAFLAPWTSRCGWWPGIPVSRGATLPESELSVVCLLSAEIRKSLKQLLNQEVLLTYVHATPPWAMMLCPCFFSWNIITISVIFVELQNWPPCKLMTCLVYIWMSGN